ncbi:hypothetical protein ACXET9_15105 [Brachybacterium sp. DNPG3]
MRDQSALPPEGDGWSSGFEHAQGQGDDAHGRPRRIPGSLSTPAKGARIGIALVWGILAIVVIVQFAGAGRISALPFLLIALGVGATVARVLRR